MELFQKSNLDSPFDVTKTSAKMNISEVFREKRSSYLNEFTLFMAHFNAIPNYINEIDIDCTRAIKWFNDAYKSEIIDLYYNKVYYNRKKKAEIDDMFFLLYDDLLVDFDSNQSTVRFLFRKTEISKIEKIIVAVQKFKIKKQRNKPEISLLVNSMMGIEVTPFKVTKPKLNIEDNYNDDFKDIHKIILKRLSKMNDKGLVLLHGKPGTGKTSYIRFLIRSLKKDVVFLPPNMASAITDPSLISILIEHPNTVFVIEDAENIIIDREKEGVSPVSALLNISDGLLADCLNVQVICSFNTDTSKIDSALLRKGRLIAKYEFKELEVNKAQELSNKLGFTSIIDQPMSLTSIYNQGETDFKQSQNWKPIGFQAINN